jgi:hypothetical protein
VEHQQAEGDVVQPSERLLDSGDMLDSGDIIPNPLKLSITSPELPMRTHGITRLLISNEADFARSPWRTILDPATLAASATPPSATP